MLWFIVLFVFIVIAAGASLVVSRGSRNDLATGRPTFESVADLTGIWNRARLDELIGPCGDDDRYIVDAETVAKIPQTWWKRWFDRDLGDVGCIVLAIAAALLMHSNSLLAWCFVTVAAAYIVVGYIGGVAVVMRNRS